MDATINALGQLLLRALPTFFLVLLLHFYLKAVFFKPLERTLAQRREATEGARQAAQESLARAEAKAAEYENSIRAARTEMYREQEQVRTKWREDQAAQVRAARERAGQMIAESRAQLQREAEEAKASLAAHTQALADQITTAVLGRRAA